MRVAPVFFGRDAAEAARAVKGIVSPMRPKRAMGRSGRVVAGAAGIVAVAIALVTVVAVVGAVGVPGAGVGATGSPAPVAAVTSVPSPAVSAPSSPGSGSPSASSATSSSAPPSASSASPSASPSPSPDPSAVPAERLQALLDRLRARTFVPGVSVAILWDDGRRWLGASGLRDVAGDLPMTTDTGFSLASISKTYTAAVVLELVGEGKLSLDRPVALLLPAFHLDQRITLRMLLDHTSGLPDFFMGGGIDAALQRSPDAAWTPMVAWRYLPRVHGIPGKIWSYSNTNYLLLGEIVQAVTGNTLSHEIRARLLDPMRLGSTWYQAVEPPRVTLSKGYRLVAVKGGGFRSVSVAPPSDIMPFRSVITAAGGAGSIGSTALDTARWMQAYAGGRVLRPAMQHAMLGDLLRTVLRHASVPYGLGIEEVVLAGHPALGHGGRFIGYRSVVRYLPDLGITIAVLTNQGDYDPARIAAQLIHVVAPPAPSPSPAPWPSPPSPAAPSPSG
jgi:D-alanyl-D-alanine carboxypeptidase